MSINLGITVYLQRPIATAKPQQQPINDGPCYVISVKQLISIWMIIDQLLVYKSLTLKNTHFAVQPNNFLSSMQINKYWYQISSDHRDNNSVTYIKTLVCAVRQWCNAAWVDPRKLFFGKFCARVKPRQFIGGRCQNNEGKNKQNSVFFSNLPAFHIFLRILKKNPNVYFLL